MDMDKQEKYKTLGTYLVLSIYFTRIAITILDHFSEENHKSFGIILDFAYYLDEFNEEQAYDDKKRFEEISAINESYGLIYIRDYFEGVEIFRLGPEKIKTILNKALDELEKIA
jgi:hypothetical protein